MLYVRYSAFFPLQASQHLPTQLLLSLISLERNVARYAETCVVLYTTGALKQSYVDLCSHFSFKSQVIALDTEHGSRFQEWEAFAETVKHKTPTDHRCIVRMLADFHILPRDSFRLLVGCDICFMDVPQELLTFLWSGAPREKVLYMLDVISFGGKPYKLRYYKPPMLRGLLGDFYCLAPGVHLSESAITGCLKMIDAWPTGPARWDPEILARVTHACEQQAAAILLEPFGGKRLPTARYSHEARLPELAVWHTKDYLECARSFDQASLQLAHRILESWVERERWSVPVSSPPAVHAQSSAVAQ